MSNERPRRGAPYNTTQHRAAQGMTTRDWHAERGCLEGLKRGSRGGLERRTRKQTGAPYNMS
eukprot:5679732-Pyramimonas_sp.AAC.1